MVAVEFVQLCSIVVSEQYFLNSMGARSIEGTCCFVDSRQQCKGPASIGVSNLRNQSLDAPIEEALRVGGS